MNFAAISTAFSQPLELEGFVVKKVQTADTVLSIRVLPSAQTQVAIALFEASPPESLNLVLANGFEFQEFEWSDPFQIEYAQEFAQIVLAFLRGEGQETRGGMFGRKNTYLVKVGDSIARSRSRVRHELLKRLLGFLVLAWYA